MPGLAPGIHAAVREGAAWMAGTSPAMTAVAEPDDALRRMQQGDG
jgi:hypothetical protein